MIVKRLKPAAIVPDALYVERAADRQLKTIIDEMGRPGYVLVARQMGKTNLLLHMKRERVDDIVLYHDLSSRFDNARLWFRNIIDVLMEAYGDQFPNAIQQIAEQRKDAQLEANVEYDRHLRLILREVRRKIIIILDEIDSLVNTSYSDVILSQIRSMYFSRANYPEYENLTYVLSGVVEPTDLIKDKNISPFNIGEKIYLENFDYLEFSVFLQKASLSVDEDVALRIYDWTNGNPRITWDVCAEIENIVTQAGFVTKEDVDRVVEKTYLNEFDRAPVDHIRTLVKSDSKIQDAIVEIRYEKGEALDQQIKNKLYLAGIIKSAGGKVAIANGVVDAALSDVWLKSIASPPSSIFTKAKIFYDGGNYGAVIEEFESIGATNDEQFSVHDRQLLALSYLYMGKFESAVRELKLCLSEQPDPSTNQYLHLELGVALAAKKDFIEAGQELIFAALGPDLNVTYKAQLEQTSIALLSDDLQVLNGGLLSCGHVIRELRVEAQLSVESEAIIVLAYYLKSQILYKIGKEIEANIDLENALGFAEIIYKPSLLLARAEMSKRRHSRVSLAREIVDLVTKNNINISVGNDLHLQLGTEKIAKIFLLLINENLVQEFKDFTRHYVNIAFDENVAEFAALKHLYAEFDNNENQSDFVGILVWGIRYFALPTTDWREKLEAYREVVMTYQGNERADFRSRYLNELSLHDSAAETFFDPRHTEAMTVIGTACLQGSDWRLGRRLFDLWEKYRNLAEPADIHTLMMDYIALLGAKAGQLFSIEAYEVAQRILKTTKEHEAFFRKSSESDLVQMLRREAEATTKFVPTPILSDEDIFRSLGRNDWVVVQYPVSAPAEKKFKFVADDLRAGRCTLLEVLRRS